ncbi:GNAT family N-acetyltransferase [Burkholderia pyrrocinia]|uniref:GNAT family N-acetyltransferase n=1 Tax=Burkholderia pyrrocinia TaxID=60550 RepID=UPI003BB0F8F6
MRYALNDGETDVVECAIVIDDAWHRQGLGRALLSSLIDLAGRSGMKRMVGTTWIAIADDRQCSKAETDSRL